MNKQQTRFWNLSFNWVYMFVYGYACESQFPPRKKLSTTLPSSIFHLEPVYLTIYTNNNNNKKVEMKQTRTQNKRVNQWRFFSRWHVETVYSSIHSTQTIFNVFGERVCLPFYVFFIWRKKWSFQVWTVYWCVCVWSLYLYTQIVFNSRTFFYG